MGSSASVSPKDDAEDSTGKKEPNKQVNASNRDETSPAPEIHEATAGGSMKNLKTVAVEELAKMIPVREEVNGKTKQVVAQKGSSLCDDGEVVGDRSVNKEGSSCSRTPQPKNQSPRTREMDRGSHEEPKRHSKAKDPPGHREVSTQSARREKESVEGESDAESQSRSASHRTDGSEDWYTSSAYTETEESGEHESDDTFYEPKNLGKERKRSDSFDEDEVVGGDGGIPVQGPTERGDPIKEGLGGTPPAGAASGWPAAAAAAASPAAGESTKKPAAKKNGRTKRRRHYIKDDTMRTLFGLIPFYGGEDSPMDQMVKSTLATVGSNNIDVRDQEGNTLLILACQHSCEDLVEPILAKGANPLVVNGAGICALHYTCFADSLSLDSAEALLWKGADPSVTEFTYGCTPLHYAASAGDAELCTLLLEHGAQPQVQDFYNYKAVQYARDAGHTALVELLGDDSTDEEEWPEMSLWQEEVGGDDATRTGGLWLRHIDPETNLAYHTNDETGESWWEADLAAAVKSFLDATSSTGKLPGGGVAATDMCPPLGVREWLIQEQVRSWLVAIFSRVDPMRLIEVDSLMEQGKADFKKMLLDLLLHYGVRDLKFLVEASCPQLERLRMASLLLPTEDSLGSTLGAKESVIEESPPDSSMGMGISLGKKDDARCLKREEADTDGRAVGRQATLPRDASRRNLHSVKSEGDLKPGVKRVASARGGLRRVDSLAVTQAFGNRQLQDLAKTQEKELEEERRRQQDTSDEQAKVIARLETQLEKERAVVTKAKEEVDRASSSIAELQSRLADDKTGKEAREQLKVEITKLKAEVAAERVRFNHITEAIQATKCSQEERTAKQRAQEEERCARLAQLGSKNKEELEKIHVEAREELAKSKNAWHSQKQALEEGLKQQVERAKESLRGTEEASARAIAEASDIISRATDEGNQATRQTREAREWMAEHEEKLAQTKQADQTNKELNKNLRREMERAKQICIRDGKQTLAFLYVEQRHWTYTHVFQNQSREPSSVAAAQAEMHRELAGLGVSLADGNNILVLVAGARGSGKTITLFGDPDEAQRAGGFLLSHEDPDARAVDKTTTASSSVPVEQHAENAKPKAGMRRGKDKPQAGDGTGAGAGGGGTARAIPLAGLFPRLAAEMFATLTHRKAQCAFTVCVSAAAVSTSAAETVDDRNAAVECLLPIPPAKPCATSETSGGDVDDPQLAEETRDPVRPPPSPPDDVIWGREETAVSPHEAVAIVEAARLRAAAVPTNSPSGGCSHRHFLSRMRVELTNHSTQEISACELVIAELAEERSGDTWPSALAKVVRDHAAPTAVNSEQEKGKDSWHCHPLLGMVRTCLTDTAKVITLLCLNPAESQGDKTERVLEFGKACQDSGEGVASQLRDLKKELTRLKKEHKGVKRTPTSQLPRPAAGRKG